MKNNALIFMICMGVLSCTRLDVFEKMVIMPRQLWYYDNKPAFSLAVQDTLSAYNIFIVLRHTDAYRYNNIWLSVGVKMPGDIVRSQNVEITLGSDANGWEGNGMDDIFEVRKKVTGHPVFFKKAGTYTFTVNQIMRENPLKNVLNVGIRIERVAF